MNRFNQAWADFVIRRRRLILIATALLLILAPLSFGRLYFDNSNEAYFLQHDPNLIAFDKLLDRYGDVEYLVIGIPHREQDADVFNAATLSMIEELSDFLEGHEYVSQVRSLSRYQYTHDVDGLLATDDLFEDIAALPAAPEQLERAREIMRGESLALGTLITPDFKDTRIAARVSYLKNENYHNVKLVTDLLNFIRERAYREQGFDIKLSGVPVVGERFETLTLKDQAWLNPSMTIIICAILFVVFRSFFATLTPLLVIIATMLLITGLQGLLRWPHTAVTSGLLPTMIILSIGTSVHVLVEFFQARRKGLAPAEAARSTVHDLLFAVFFTSSTTSVGFLALAVTDLLPVQQFSLLAAFGPMAIFLLATASLPALLSYVPWMPRNKTPQGEEQETRSPIHWLTEHLPDFTYRHRKTLGVLGIAFSTFSFYSVSFIRVDTNVVNYFKEKSWVNQDLLYFNEKFKGISNLEVMLDSGEEGGVKNPVFLQRAEALQSWLESFPESGNAVSLLDFYKQINQAMHEDRQEFFILPDSRELAAQFLITYENSGPDEDLSDMKDFYERYLRISIPVMNMDASQTSAFLDKVQSGLSTQFSDLPFDLTGSLVMSNAQNVYVDHGMYRSFGVAIFVIGLCFLLLFRSLKYGLIALIPSIIPILLTGGLVSLFGISLDLGTMIVGAMTIGIAVDDSIHLMSRYLLHKRRGLDTREALRKAMSSSGRAVILTSVILIVGFSVMLLGSFVPFIYFGLFSAMIMSFALLGDLLFMPALIYLVDAEKEHASTASQAPTKGVLGNVQ